MKRECVPIQVRAGKESKFSIYISDILTVIIEFSMLFCLSLIFSVTTSKYSIGLVLLYAVFFPVLILVRHSYTYFVLLPVPYLGSLVLSIVFLSSSAIPMLHASILVSIIPAISATFIHSFSRMRSMIRTVPMMSANRSGAAFISALFFMAGTVILGPTPIQLDTTSKTIFYCSLLFAYTAFSMLYVNSAYRYRVICKVFKKNRIEPKLSEIWEKIRDKFSGREKDVDLLKYFFSNALRLFEEGSYENAFISGHKVINETTIVDPRKHVSDRRKGEPSSFSEIRTILMHSRRRDVRIDVSRIREIKKQLPQYTVELLQRGLDLLEKLSE